MQPVPDEIPVTPLTRFAVEGGKFKNGVARPKLFEPNRQGELSVSRTGGLKQPEVQDIGLQVVRDNPNASRLHGWATIERDDVEDIGLRVIDDDEPPRHSNVVGWPAGWPEEREQVLDLMQDLASKADPLVLDSPIVA